MQQRQSAFNRPNLHRPGFNIKLRALPVDGRIVLLPPDGDTNGK